MTTPVLTNGIAPVQPWVAEALRADGSRPFAPARTITGLQFPSNAAVAVSLLATATPKRGPRGIATMCRKQATAHEIADSGVHALILAMRAHRKFLSDRADKDMPLGEVAALAAEHFAAHSTASALCFELAGQFLLEPARTEVRVSGLPAARILAMLDLWIARMASDHRCAPERVLTHLNRLSLNGGGR